MKFEDCAYEYKIPYCTYENCVECGGYTPEQWKKIDLMHKKAKEDADKW